MAAARLVRRAAWVAAIGLLLAGTIGVTPTRAVGFLFIVNTKGDGIDANPLDNACETASGSCSLRAAVMQANVINPGTGSHEIRINGTAFYMEIENTGGDENAAEEGDYDILQNTRIVGSGVATTILRAGSSLGDGIDRFFDIRGNNIDVEITGMTLLYGDANGGTGGTIRGNDAGSHITLDDVIIERSATTNAGVAIWSRSDLEITDSIIRNNEGRNGIIFTDGANVTIRRSTISENTTTFNGSALYAQGESVATVERSTISGNTSGTGGPIVVGSGNLDDSKLTLRNSTVSGNTANAANGAMVASFAQSIVTIESSTIGSNSGFGLDLDGPSSIKNTILAGNTRTSCAQEATSAGHNLDAGTTCGFDAIGDLSPGSAQFGPLQDNGGPTFTRALKPESDAIDAGAGCPTVDQRGNSRPKDGNGDGVATCDIGAFEAPKVAVTPTAAPTEEPTPEPTPEQTEAPSAAPTSAASEAPPTAAPSIAPGSSPSPTVLPVASDGSPIGTPAATQVPEPAVGGEGGNQVLVVGFALLLLILLAGLFLVLRRRRPKPAV